ncbi:MAG TPA: GntR family transcriptional regulator [Acetobacteraceae bacterium]|nr:GntR family transcriptional regulator [Acetobacteraceae bacterium]
MGERPRGTPATIRLLRHGSVQYVPRPGKADGGRADGATVESESLRNVVSRLEEDVILGRLHPRERLVEDDLMARFGAKRHLVRQALAELERMGIVERIPNRGASVRAYDIEEIKQLYMLRNLLETYAAGQIPMPLPEADIADLKRIQAVHDKAVGSGDLGAVYHANVAYHRTLFAKSGNPYLAEAINDFAQRTHGIRFYCFTYPGHLEAMRTAHWKMIEAIEACDRRALVRLCADHLLASRECYERVAGIRPATRHADAKPARDGTARRRATRS